MRGRVWVRGAFCFKFAALRTDKHSRGAWMTQMSWVMEVAGLVAAGVTVVALAVRSAETRMRTGGRQNGTPGDLRLGGIGRPAPDAAMRGEGDDI